MQILDAVTGTEKLGLIKELKTIRANMDGKTGLEKLGFVKRVKEIRQAILGDVPEPDKAKFERKWPLSVEEAKAQGLIETFYHDREKRTMWRVGIDAKNFNTGGEALDYYFEVVKPRDDASELSTKSQDLKDLLAEVLAGTDTWIAAKDPNGEYAHVLKPGADKSETMQLRSFRSMIINDDIPVKWIGNMDLLNLIRMKALSDAPAVEQETKPQATIADINAVMPLIKQFIGKSQLAAMGSGVRGEEGQFFKDKFIQVANVIKGMPQTYETDGQGNKAVAYLHYFKGGMDWYITEKDAGDVEDAKEGISGQVQAFGYADLGQGGGEMGYISIKELIESGVELDLYWSPKTIGEIKGVETTTETDDGDEEYNRYAEMSASDVMTLSPEAYAMGLEVFEQSNEHTEYVLFAAKRTGMQDFIDRANSLIQEQENSPEGVTMAFTDKRFELLRQINAALTPKPVEVVTPDPVPATDPEPIADPVPAGNTELDRQKAKLAGLMADQERMKNANKVVKNKKLSDDQKVAQLVAQGLSQTEARGLLRPDFAGRVGFADYMLTNNNANIKRVRDRVQDLEAKEVAEKMASSGTRETTYEFDGGSIELNYGADRLQVFFDAKPDSSTISKLKSNGFKWSPSNVAWQRQLTDNAIYVANRLFGTSIKTAAQAAEDDKTNWQETMKAENQTTTATGLQDPIKVAFIAELEALKAETDIPTYDKRLDEIAGRIEQAGLMDALDAELNSAADVLTELLAEAEKA